MDEVIVGELLLLLVHVSQNMFLTPYWCGTHSVSPQNVGHIGVNTYGDPFL